MKETSGDLERQTLNSGGTVPAELELAKTTSPLVGASVCQQCDGTGWTPHGTKGLTKCHGIGLPHGH